MKKVLGIGNALVDVMTILDNDEVLRGLAFPKGSMQLVDLELSTRIKEETSMFVNRQASGGSAANTIHGLSKLGVVAGYIGAVGSDSTGDIFENDMKSAGVNTMLLRRIRETGTAVAMITPDSERTFATHLGAATEMSSGDLPPEMFRGYDFLYLEGYLVTNMDLVRYVCQMAKENGLKIVIDMASFNVVDAFLGDFRELVENWVDIIFANEEEARSFTGLGPEEALQELAGQCEIAIVKVGKQGSIIARGHEKVKVNSIDVTSIDTTGAGDLYAAGFLYGLAGDEPLEKCGAYGALLAGNVIEVFGPKMDDTRWKNIFSRIEEIRIA
ncbi:MAG: adenosine kinase [Bacteroidia bacterium]|nr:MAG: adenosine kinase [Bacteroidia bacterium]